MHLRKQRQTLLQSAIGQVADPVRRREIAEQATDAAARIASDLAKKSADLGPQVASQVSDAAHKVADEGHALLEERAKNVKRKAVKNELKKAETKKAKKPRKHRLRKVVLLSGAGAAAAYFLDPDNGGERRAAVRTRTSGSARVVGDGLDRAAHVAHQAAEVTATTGEAEAPQRSDLIGG